MLEIYLLPIFRMYKMLVESSINVWKRLWTEKS